MTRGAAELGPRGEGPVASVGSGVSPTTAARQIHRSLSAWAERQAETADAPDGDRWSTTLHRSAQSAGSRIMRAEDPAKKKEKALTEIKAKAATFANFQCTQCADALKAILVKAGVKGSIIRITNKPPNKNGFVYCVSRGANISNTNYHVGVVVDGVASGFCTYGKTGGRRRRLRCQ